MSVGVPPYIDQSKTGDLPFSQRHAKTPPQQITEDQGWGLVTLRWLPTVEVGSTARFQIATSHAKDGVFNPTGLAFSILNTNGWSVPSGTSGVTIPAAQSPSKGTWYSDIQFGALLVPGEYIVQVVGSYVAGDGNTIKIQIRRNFTVRSTKKRNPLTFRRTDQY